MEKYCAEVRSVDYAKIIAGLSSTISHQAAEVNEKIRLLESAKQQVTSERTLSMNDMSLVTNPELGEGWKGKRSTSFDEQRESAKEELKRILQDEYEDYLSDIDSAILKLESQQLLLNGLSFVATEASSLVHKGEEAADDLHRKISHIRGRL